MKLGASATFGHLDLTCAGAVAIFVRLCQIYLGAGATYVFSLKY